MLSSGGRKKMDFGAQIKELRKSRNLTQEEFASQLNVTRQAISNWENNRNLPDLETVLHISEVFHISLDELILGGNKMNNMTEKLVNDGKETRRAKMNLTSVIIGAALMLIGLSLFVIKAMSVEYVDAQGTLHENFFLIPLGYLFLLSGVIAIASSGVRALLLKHKEKR